MGKLDGKIAIVTGSGRGIGRGIAMRLGSDGATVVVSDIMLDNAKRTAAEIEAAGGKAFAIQTDVTKQEQCEALVAQTVAKFGKLDIMVANAGIGIVKLSLDHTEEDWDKTLAVNVKGIFFCDTAAAKQMIKQGHKGYLGSGGKIINCASIAAHGGWAYLPAYSASKFAVRGFTQAFAKEMAPNKITVNAYCPGIVGTDMWDLIDEKIGAYTGAKKGETLKASVDALILAKEVGKPEQVAGYVSYLASEDADYMTGQSVMIDGGIVLV
ncbi:MAG: glucose 1-dehydrogenase [Geobacteraceae bacterium]|nr:glucose 1-dehydrogenase [Geobacteraceae bacterium]